MAKLKTIQRFRRRRFLPCAGVVKIAAQTRAAMLAHVKSCKKCQAKATQAHVSRALDEAIYGESGCC